MPRTLKVSIRIMQFEDRMSPSGVELTMDEVVELKHILDKLGQPEKGRLEDAPCTTKQ